LHPVIFAILMEDHQLLDFHHLRLTRDSLSRSRQTTRGQWLYRLSHAAIYAWLSRRALAPLRERGIKHAQFTFGLLQNARVDEASLLKLLPLLPPGDSELYSHPSLDNFTHEFNALVSPRVKESLSQLDIGLIRYQDL